MKHWLKKISNKTVNQTLQVKQLTSKMTSKGRTKRISTVIQRHSLYYCLEKWQKVRRGKKYRKCLKKFWSQQKLLDSTKELFILVMTWKTNWVVMFSLLQAVEKKPAINCRGFLSLAYWGCSNLIQLPSFPVISLISSGWLSWKTTELTLNAGLLLILTASKSSSLYKVQNKDILAEFSHVIQQWQRMHS